MPLDEHPFSPGTAVTGNQYTTVFRFKQDAQPVFVVLFQKSGRKDADCTFITAQNQFPIHPYRLRIRIRQDFRIHARGNNDQIGFHPAEQITNPSAVVSIPMGQNHPVQPADALTAELAKSSVRGIFPGIPSAVYQKSLSTTLQKNTLALSHIQHGHPAPVRQGP